MEDAIAINLNIMLPHGTPGSITSNNSTSTSIGSPSNSGNSGNSGNMSTRMIDADGGGSSAALFAIFDGHGGCDASAYAAKHIFAHVENHLIKTVAGRHGA